MTRAPFTRRDFLAQSASLSLLGTFPLTSSWTRPRADKLRLASIGVGGMGASDLGSLSSHPNVEVVALCDVDANNLQAAANKFPKAQRFSDFRKMFDAMKDGIDAVNVATPDHTHAAASVTAMQLRKHVYCQKPLTHDIYEARQMRLIAESMQLVSQMGTQIHSTTQYRTAVKLIQAGAIGKVRRVHSWCNKGWGYDGETPKETPVPAHLDWNLWLGTAPERPFAEGHYHPFNWRKWCDFGCGTMGDMAIHILDPVFSALRLTTPIDVLSTSPLPPAQSFALKNETTYRFPATEFTTSDFILTWHDGDQMPDTSEWPEKEKLPSAGSMFVGEKGWMLLPHIDMPKLLPAKSFEDYPIEPAPNGDHYHLWVDACLGGLPTTAGFSYAGPLTEAVLLGVVANRFPGQTLSWNPAHLQVSNFEPAQSWVRRKYRAGFEVDGLS